MDVITTEFIRLEDAERLRIFRHIFRRRRQGWYAVAGVGVLISVVALATGSSMGFALGACLALAGVADLFFLDSYVRRSLKDPKNKAWTQSTRGIYTADKVTIEAEDGSQTSMPWTTFICIEKLGDVYLLYFVRHNALIIFRRYLTDEEWALFTEWAEMYRARLPS